MGQVTLTLVDCAPLSARLTEASCIKRWRAAQGDTPPPSWDSLRHCHTCPVGAIRAGASASVAVNAAIAASFNHICPRCERVASRLINGRTCTSCYNRTAEAVKGVNAKGTRPRLADVIHPETLAVGGRLVRVDHVVSRIEAAAIAARQAGPGAIIGVPPLAPLIPAGFFVPVPLFLPMPVGSVERELRAAPPLHRLVAGRRHYRRKSILKPQKKDRAYMAHPALPL